MINSRSSGILLHITSLPSQYGMGDLGPAAFEFIKFLNQSSQQNWQVLPIHPTDALSDFSPYSSCSAFAANATLISPEILIEDQYCNADVLKKYLPTHMSFEGAHAFKDILLKEIFDINGKKILEDAAYQDFVQKNAYWLDDYAVYQVLKNIHSGESWVQWEEKYRYRDPEALNQFCKENIDVLNQVKCNQYIFDVQWNRLKNYAQKNGVSLIGDIPIYVSLDSADVWCHREIFKLSGDSPEVVAGVPPDYFSKNGQLWGNPVYDWTALSQQGYQWWIQRFTRMFDLFHTVRVDHFRAFVNYWEVPYGAVTAKEGYWVNVPTDDFFKTLQSSFHELPIIAEDLGMIDHEIRVKINELGYPGMKILIFAFNGDMKSHPYLPHNFDENSVVYTGTHDNNTTVGWYESDATKLEKEKLQLYLCEKVNKNTVHWQMIKMALESKSNIAIIPLQDVLGLDQASRMNIPGTASGNWRWQIAELPIAQDIISQLASITIESSRGKEKKAHAFEH